jgi:hypothetical protein
MDEKVETTKIMQYQSCSEESVKVALLKFHGLCSLWRIQIQIGKWLSWFLAAIVTSNTMKHMIQQVNGKFVWEKPRQGM